MKVSKKDLCLLIALLGILVGVAGYYLIYAPTQEKISKLKADNTVINEQVGALTEKASTKSAYIDETARMNAEIEEIYSLFPVDVKEEDAIALAITQEMTAPMEVDSISISGMNDKDFEEQANNNANKNTTLEEDVNNAIAGGVGVQAVDGYDIDSLQAADIGPLNCRQCAITYRVTYDGLKKSISNIMNQDSRMTIDSVSVSFDDTTGLLEGSTVVNMYALPMQEGKEYVAPSTSGVLLGNRNIFGTKKVVEEEIPEEEISEEE